MEQVRINGKVFQNAKGFYWKLWASFPDGDKLEMDSSEMNHYLPTKTAAIEDLKTLGKDIGHQLVSIFNDIAPGCKPYLVDHKKESYAQETLH